MTAAVCTTCGQRYDRAGYCVVDGQPLVATDDPLLGTEVGRYRMARLLGEGGMGRVYLAVQPAIGSRVAIKILSDQCARNPELLDRFFSEARAVNLVHHESIVSVIDLAQLPDGRPYIVMEYIEGQTLAAVVRSGPVPLGGLVQVMSEVLSALAAAHAIGIVHRDLKPDNILITAEGHAKVLDFGIAKLAPELQQQLSPRTRTGALLGTPQYMAPEQISGSGAVDPRTDLYAAGVVIYELATGRLPFTGETLFDLMRGHLEQPPPPPRGLRRDLPPAFEQVILTALAKQPGDRFHSAAEMSHALHQAAGALPPDQWRSLSARAQGAAGTGPRSDSQLPLAYRATRPAGAAPTVGGAGRVGLVIGAVVAAAIAVVATLFVVARGRGDGAGSGAVALAVAGSASAPASVATAQSTPGGVTTSTQPTAGSAAASGSVAGGSGAGGAAAVGAGGSGAGGPGASHAAASGAAADGSADPPATMPTAGAPAKAMRPSTKTTSHKTAGGPPGTPQIAAPAGAQIVGGGSAADHGVIVGPNVTTGPNVVIGAGQPQPAIPRLEELERPADYNAKRFDPVAYLPAAELIARELVPDARLTSFEFDPAFADGHVDLTLDGRDRSYEFRSAARSAFPAGRPRNMPIARRCRITVEVGARRISARVVSSDTCADRFIRPPRCSFASVWKQALARGAAADLIARIGWLSDETWFFDIAPSGSGGVSSFADRCP